MLKSVWLKWWSFGTEEVYPRASSSLSPIKAAKAQFMYFWPPKSSSVKTGKDQALQLECLERTHLPAHLTAARGHHVNAFSKKPFKKSDLRRGNRGRVLLCLAVAFVTRDKNSFEEMSGKTSLTPPAPSKLKCKKTMKIIPLYGKKSPLPKCWGWPHSSSSQPRGKMCIPWTLASSTTDGVGGTDGDCGGQSQQPPPYCPLTPGAENCWEDHQVMPGLGASPGFEMQREQGPSRDSRNQPSENSHAVKRKIRVFFKTTLKFVWWWFLEERTFLQAVRW